MMNEAVYVVLGVHRGGTSALSKGVNALGVSLGEKLLPAAPDNEQGFWEDRDIVKLNDEVLDAFDDSWHSLKILDEHSLDPTIFCGLVTKGRALLEQRVKAFSPYGFKDPRTARLLFYWQRVFQGLDIEPRYILALRNPLSVACSLQMRERFPAEKALLLWLQHMLSALRWTEGRHRVVVDYDHLLADPIVQLERIRQTLQMLPANKRQIEEYVGGFLSVELRHFSFESTSVRQKSDVPKIVSRLYSLLDRLARDELSADSDKVSREARHMWAGLLDVAPAFAFAEKDSREWSKTVADRDGQIAEASKVLVDRDGQIQDLVALLADRDREITEYAKVVADHEAQIKGHTNLAANRDEQIQQLADGVAERDGHITEYAKIVADREARLHHLVATVTERDNQVAERDGHITEYAKIVADREARIQHLIDAVTERDNHIAERDRQIGEFGKMLASRDEYIRQLAIGVAERDGHVAEYAKIVADREERIQALIGKLSERDKEIADLAGQLTESVKEIDQSKVELGILKTSLADERAEFGVLRSRLDDTGRQLYGTALNLQHIEGSSFWRATTILRHAWRFLENRIFGLNFTFHLVPNNDLEVLRGAYDWRAVGHDPHFQMIPVDDRYPSGWVSVSSCLQRSPEDYRPKLYYDAGRGMSEETSFSLPVTEFGTVHELVWLPRGIKQMRWDPMQGMGQLSQKPILISRVGPIDRALRRIIRVWKLMRQRDAAKLREEGISWHHLLSQPRRTYEAISALRNRMPEVRYEAWLDAHALTDSDRSAIRRHISRFERQPLISVLMPVYNTPPDLLRAAIDSVRAQLYENWELCIADDASTATHVRKILEKYRHQDQRIKVEYRPVNGHISAASNTALAVAEGEYITLLDHDDMLSEQALYQVVAELDRHPDTDIIYSDEDKIDEKGERRDPHFKPDWNPDLLYSQNYASHLGVYRTALAISAGGFREGFEGSQDYDLLLRCVTAAKSPNVLHIPAVLYHWRATSGSTALSLDNKQYATQNGIRALEDHFRSCGMEGASVEPGRYPTTYRVRFPLPPSPPKVSLIIPTRDGHDVLRACIDSIREKTAYPNYEIVVVDNQSSDERTLAYFDEIQAVGVRLLRYDQPFNYPAINNFAVEQVDGGLVGLINNDIEVISPEWLTEMASHALRPEVGAVGAKLYYTNGTIQHAGVILGVGGVAGHSHKHFPRDAPGYFSRLLLAQNLSAVTAACLLVRRETYLKVGGLDGTNLAVAFNDVDFCLRLCDLGLRNVWTPYAELYHHESLSRGPEDSPEKIERFQSEIRYMMERWGERLRRDPCYSPMLNLDREDFRPNFNAAPPKPWCSGAD